MKYFSTVTTTALILIAVTIPGSQMPGTGFTGLDKVIHAFMFFTWSLALQFDYSCRPRWRGILVLGILFGLGTEMLQLQIKNRSFDWVDWLFDSLGLILAAATGLYLLPRLEKIWPLTLLKRIKQP